MADLTSTHFSTNSSLLLSGCFLHPMPFNSRSILTQTSNIDTIPVYIAASGQITWNYYNELSKNTKLYTVKRFFIATT